MVTRCRRQRRVDHTRRRISPIHRQAMVIRRFVQMMIKIRIKIVIWKCRRCIRTTNSSLRAIWTISFCSIAP
eukprot:Gb_28059 [translate_table: standard]